jgi:hypothetical protein
VFGSETVAEFSSERYASPSFYTYAYIFLCEKVKFDEVFKNISH